MSVPPHMAPGAGSSSDGAADARSDSTVRGTLSVVVPTFGKDDLLRLTLSSLVPESTEALEVIVVNDGGPGSTDAVVHSYADRLNVTLVQGEHGGRATARNRGIAAAQGDRVLFMDDDRIAAPGLVQAHAGAAETDAVIGWKKRALTVWQRGVLPVKEDDFLRLAEQAPEAMAQLSKSEAHLISPEALEEEPEEAMARLDLGEEADNHGEVVTAHGPGLEGFLLPWALGTTANMSVSASALHAIKGFDERFSGWGFEDTDLSYRLHGAGMRFRVAREAQNWHQIHPLGSGGLSLARAHRQTEAVRNLKFFCEVHGGLEALVFSQTMTGGLSLLGAEALLRELQGAGSLVVDELSRLYRQALSGTIEFG